MESLVGHYLVDVNALSGVRSAFEMRYESVRKEIRKKHPKPRDTRVGCVRE